MTGGAQVWIQFASPTGFSGTGVRWISTDEIYDGDDLPIGSATQGVEALLDDASGHPLAPHHAGQLQFTLPTRTEPIAGLRAWRSDDGILHPIFVEKPKPAPKLIVSIPEPEPEPQPAQATPAPAPEIAWEPLTILCESQDGPTLYLIHDADGSPERYRALAAQFEGEWTLKATTARGSVKPSQCHRTVEKKPPTSSAPCASPIPTVRTIFSAMDLARPSPSRFPVSSFPLAMASTSSCSPARASRKPR